jgi:putative ABC transport system substrate-binding protein
MYQLNVKELARRALEARVPGMCEVSEFTAAGGLLSYGPSAAERQQRARAEMGRRVQTLRREPPASASVVAPKLELVINLKTAKALGLTIPQSILLRADQVIE